MSLLQGITAPVIKGVERCQIINLFRSGDYITKDKEGKLASFIVTSSSDIPLLYFSLRCGELFERTILEKVAGLQHLNVAFMAISNPCTNDKEKSESLETIVQVSSQGMTLEEMELLSDKKEAWEMDNKMDKNKGINKVLRVYPAIELKLFGTNSAAKGHWKALGLEDIRMGESLFFTKVVDTIQSMLDYAGCQYVYLFAAGQEIEGQLVQYYRTILGFDSNAKITANKPVFDWACQFLFQDIDNLRKQRKKFIESIKNKEATIT